MYVKPLTRQLVHPIGLVTNDGTVMGEWGYGSWDALPDGVVLYYRDSHQFLAQQYDEGNARRRIWKKARVTNGPGITTKSYVYRDRLIRSTRDAFEGLSDDEALLALLQWADFYRYHGANVGSLGGTALSLLRATLTRPLMESRIRPPDDILIPLLGSRQENIGGGTYDDCEAWDISSAYPHAFGNLRMPSRWQRYASAPDRGCAFLRCSVRISGDSNWGPLPLRERGRLRFPRRGDIEGWWSLDEVQAARDYGATVTVHESWVGIPTRDVFAEWWRIVATGKRELPPAAARLLKASVNTVWASFCADGQTYETWRQDDGTQYRKIGGRRPPQSMTLSALVSSKVRARVFTEAMSRLPVAAVHTDGVILLGQGWRINPCDGKLGSWRLTDRIDRLRMTTAQVYTYMNETGTQVWKHSGTKLPQRIGRQAFTNAAGQHKTKPHNERTGIRLHPDE